MGAIQKNNSGETTVRVEYAYDVFDHLVGRVEFLGNSSTPAKTETFVWDGWNIALVLDGAGAVSQRYFTGEAADQIFASENALGQVLWSLTDHLNTPRDFIDSAGTLLNHRVFDSFGRLVSETNPAATASYSFFFTGGYRDPLTSLDLRWHRWYDSRIGKWLSQDPLGYDAGDMNLYRYVNNSPNNENDPSGLKHGAGPVPRPNIFEGGDGELSGVSVVTRGSTRSPPQETVYQRNDRGDIVATTEERFGICERSLVLVTDDTSDGDEEDLKRLAPDSTPVVGGISSWDEASRELAKVPNGSLLSVEISGHGSVRGGGARARGSNLDFEWLSQNPEALAMLRNKLAPSGFFVIRACVQGRFSFNSVAQNLANLLQRPVIANTGDTSDGTFGAGVWVVFFPARP